MLDQPARGDRLAEKLTERMNVLQARESIEDGLELFTEGLLGVLDLTGVEACRRKKRSAIPSLSITSIIFFGVRLFLATNNRIDW